MTAFRGVWTQAFWRCVAAEFAGTALFLMLALGSAMPWPDTASDPLRTALAFGLSLAASAHAFGHVSGAHLNPALTAAMACMRKITLAKAVVYMLAQCVGAVTAAGLVYAVTPPEARGDMAVTQLHKSLSAGHGLLIEMMITFFLSFTVFSTCDPNRPEPRIPGSVAVGVAVMAGHLFAIPYTGASMNPARSLGPAIVSNNWDHHWLYWIGPMLGAVLAGAAYEYLLCPDPEIKRRLKEAFSRASPSHQHSQGAKYVEMEEAGGGREDGNLVFKPGSSHLAERPESKPNNNNGGVGGGIGVGGGGASHNHGNVAGDLGSSSA